MTAAEQTALPGSVAPGPQKMVGEWLWRFLAVVVVATIGWVLWIMYQVNLQPLVTAAVAAPPVNPERLKFADSIELPIAERGKKK